MPGKALSEPKPLVGCCLFGPQDSRYEESDLLLDVCCVALRVLMTMHRIRPHCDLHTIQECQHW